MLILGRTKQEIKKSILKNKYKFYLICIGILIGFFIKCN